MKTPPSASRHQSRFRKPAGSGIPSFAGAPEPAAQPWLHPGWLHPAVARLHNRPLELGRPAQGSEA